MTLLMIQLSTKWRFLKYNFITLSNSSCFIYIQWEEDNMRIAIEEFIFWKDYSSYYTQKDLNYKIWDKLKILWKLFFDLNILSLFKRYHKIGKRKIVQKRKEYW
jgi:hypothetical protein